MQHVTDNFTTCVALGLAVTAAVMSCLGQTDRSSQISRWLRAGFSPEAAALAGAIGEHPEVFEAP